jgi:hypothetical protein
MGEGGGGDTPSVLKLPPGGLKGIGIESQMKNRKPVKQTPNQPLCKSPTVQKNKVNGEESIKEILRKSATNFSPIKPVEIKCKPNIDSANVTHSGDFSQTLFRVRNKLQKELQ